MILFIFTLMINLGEEGEIGKGVGREKGWEKGEEDEEEKGKGGREERGMGLKGGEGWRERER